MTTRLRIRDLEFSLFYDYDELESGKLSNLSDDEKIRWFVARHEHFFLRPSRHFWGRPSPMSRAISWLYPPYSWLFSLRLAMFGAMLDAAEAMGGFLLPEARGSGKNRARFCEFHERYMPGWHTTISTPCAPAFALTDVLWNQFRNPLAHGFSIIGGGIEFLKGDKLYELSRGRVLVCPRRYAADYEVGFDKLIRDLKIDPDAKRKFMTRFQHVYPPQEKA